MKKHNIRLLSGKEQDRMSKNGWRFKFHDTRESDDQLIERLSKNYKEVKLYKSTTNVRGYHNTFALVRTYVYDSI